MKRLMLLALCGMMAGTSVNAQRLCGAQLIKDDLIARDPQNADRLLHRRIQLQQQAQAFEESRKHAQMRTTANVTIPVVFHILLTSSQISQLGGMTGIHDRVMTQVAVLNEDFGKTNADTSKIPAVWKPLAANTQIQFGLAHRKPDGSSTQGYEVITTTTSSYSYPASNAKVTSQGGVDAWDPSKYLNIWVLSMSGSLLGFTVPPSLMNWGYPFHELGVVINYGCFGRKPAGSNYYLSGFDKGRTLTHEVGHYFELEHTWGDDSGLCPGNGGQDDGITDTPPQASESTGNPTFPKFDACTPTGNGVMFMNYMDYSNDASLYMFTNNQGTLMNSHLLPANAESHELTTHPELLEWPTSVADLGEEKGMSVYPNPATGSFRIGFADASGLQGIQVMNLMGQEVWSISAAKPGISNYDVDLTGHTRGVYLVRCTFAAGKVTKKIVLQ